jgi:uncharacterized membrane protein
MMMSKVTMIFGAVLSLVGLGAYIEADHRHITALFPAFLGAPLLALGAAGQKAEHTGPAMHTAAGVGVLGLLVSAQGLFWPQLFQDRCEPDNQHPKRGLTQALTLVLCGAYVGLSFRSFLRARLARKDQP